MLSLSMRPRHQVVSYRARGECDLNGNAMPALEGCPADEIIGYDEDRLPERSEG
jgi:hypothetical protein